MSEVPLYLESSAVGDGFVDDRVDTVVHGSVQPRS